MTSRGLFVALACLTVGVSLPLHVSAQQTQLFVIEMHTRSADEVVPMLEPMLAPGGSIRAFKDKLIIRTTVANIAELRRILDVVDARPRSLLITVKQASDGFSGDAGIALSGSVESGHVRVEAPGTGAASPGTSVAERQRAPELQLDAGSTRSQKSGQILQTIRVLEGNSAFIGMGETIPIREQATVAGDAGAARSESSGTHEIVAGFYAVPRIHGDQVSVQLSATADTLFDRRTGTARIERVTSVVSAPIGQWMEIGGFTEQADGRQFEITSGRSSDSHKRKRVFIKVEQIK